MKNKTYRRLALVGFMLAVPALLIVSVGILQIGFGLRGINDGLDALFSEYTALNIIIHSIVVIGGLLIGLTLNIIPVLRIKIELESGSIIGTLRIRDRLFNVGMSALSLSLFGTLLLYSFVENFKVVPR